MNYLIIFAFIVVMSVETIGQPDNQTIKHFHYLYKDSLNVGINTWNPKKPLHIHGSYYAIIDTSVIEQVESTIRFSNGSAQSYWEYIKSWHQDENLDSIPDSTYKLTRYNDDYTESYTANISLINNSSLNAYSSIANMGDLSIQNDTNSKNLVLTIKNDSSNIIFTTTDTKGEPDNIKMLLKANGNFGIGRDNPQAKLDVNGTVKLNLMDTLYNSKYMLAIDNSGYLKIFDYKNVTMSPNYWSMIGNTLNHDDAFLGSLSNNDINFKTNNIQRMKISKDGNVNFGPFFFHKGKSSIQFSSK